VLASACVAAAALSAFAARPVAPSDRGTVAETPPLRTSLWSPRRVPALFVDAAAQVELARRLELAVANVDACVVVDAPHGSLARVHPERALAPASTLKLLTGVAALATLGPDYRFRTRALADGAGNLVLVGGGDPVLATPEHVEHAHADPATREVQFTPLSALADAIAAAGPVAFPGGVVVDDGRHEQVRLLPAWKPSYAADGDVGALGALTVDAGFADPVRRAPADDPAVVTAQRLTALLAQRGVPTAAAIRRAPAAEGAREIAHVDSPPLHDIVADMIRASLNYTAEQLIREIAAHADASRPGGTATGITRALDALRGLGVPLDGAVLHDGSGLAPDDRVSCPTLSAVLALAADPRFAPIDRGLAVAAQSGTLVDRFAGDPLAGRLRAKTGSLAGVAGLAGVVDTASGRTVRFAFAATGGFSEDGGEELQAAVARAVASYGAAPARADLVPAP
jgi:D-alanyl-D-alanine carboxypeptidase/D-alanyl-D-alanine-endopeptidase (penicillin-binding protein 4)